jgi:hypothetical protein
VLRQQAYPNPSSAGWSSRFQPVAGSSSASSTGSCATARSRTARHLPSPLPRSPTTPSQSHPAHCAAQPRPTYRPRRGIFRALRSDAPEVKHQKRAAPNRDGGDAPTPARPAAARHARCDARSPSTHLIARPNYAPTALGTPRPHCPTRT